MIYWFVFLACKRIFDALMLRIPKIRFGLTIKFLVIFMNFHTMRKDVNSKQESSLSNSVMYLKFLIMLSTVMFHSIMVSVLGQEAG